MALFINNMNIYNTYLPQIKDFAFKSLKAHVINENLKVVYEEVLADEEENFNETPDKISEKVASKNEKFNIKMNFNIQNNEQIKKFLFS